MNNNEFFKEKVNINNQIKCIIDKIINVCLIPDIFEVLNEYFVFNKYKKKKVTKLVIKKYLLDNFIFSKKEINTAFDMIKLLLKKELI